MKILAILVCVFLLALLVGCAQTFQGVCAFAPLGQNEAGVAFARVHCEAAK